MIPWQTWKCSCALNRCCCTVVLDCIVVVGCHWSTDVLGRYIVHLQLTGLLDWTDVIGSDRFWLFLSPYLQLTMYKARYPAIQRWQSLLEQLKSSPPSDKNQKEIKRNLHCLPAFWLRTSRIFIHLTSNTLIHVLSSVICWLFVLSLPYICIIHPCLYEDQQKPY